MGEVIPNSVTASSLVLGFYFFLRCYQASQLVGLFFFYPTYG